MAQTLDDLYRARCIVTADGRIRPTFWDPQPLNPNKLQPCLLGDETKTFTPDIELKVTEAIKRIITLALHLELDVGEFVLAQTKGDLPSSSEHIYNLLKSAIRDEASHDRGFRYAQAAYGAEDSNPQALAITSDWEFMSKVTHPIVAAGQPVRESSGEFNGYSITKQACCSAR